jgi:ABC-type multidrug transport system ATPase subunit
MRDNANMSFSLHISDIGKRYYNRWLFRQLNVKLAAGEKMALIGTNGSGKSTLLRIIAGQLSPTEGKVDYFTGNERIAFGNFYRHLSWAAPSIELYDELTLREHISWHFKLKPSRLASPMDLVDILHLKNDKDKKLRLYSSGMLQRVKVGLALYTQSDLLLLDEPTSNMDTRNADRILSLIESERKDRVLILASNLEREYMGFEQKIELG